MALVIYREPPRRIEQAEHFASLGGLILDWPALVVIPPPVLSKEYVAGLAAISEELFQMQTRFGVVFDLTEMVEMPNAVLRRMLADFKTAHRDNFRRYVVADASVIAQPIARGVRTAISWLSNPVQPEQFFPTRQQALAWVYDRLAADARRESA